MNRNQVLFVGIGSPHGDDQAGWLVADLLSLAVNDHHHVAIRKAKSPIDLLHWLDGVQALIVCDACRGLAQAGDVARWEWPAEELNDVAWMGTHDVSLSSALALAECLQRLPARVIIWAIEGKGCSAFETLSPAASNGISKVVERITGELGSCSDAVGQDPSCPDRLQTCPTSTTPQ